MLTGGVAGNLCSFVAPFLKWCKNLRGIESERVEPVQVSPLYSLPPCQSIIVVIIYKYFLINIKINENRAKNLLHHYQGISLRRKNDK